MENSGEKRKKLLLIGGIAGVVIVIAAVLVTLSLTVWAVPHKKDFEAVNTAAKKAHTSYHKITKPYADYFTALSTAYGKNNDPSTVEKVVKDKKAAFDRSLTAHLDDVEAIEGMTALHDKALKDSYDKFAAHEDAYVTYMKNYLAAHEQYMHASGYSCADVLTASKAAKGAKDVTSYLKLYSERNRELSKDCLSDLTKLTSSPNKPYATYGKAYKKYFTDRQKFIDEASSATGLKATLAIASLPTQLKSLTAPLEKAAATFLAARQKDIDKVADETIPESFYNLVAKKVKTTKE